MLERLLTQNLNHLVALDVLLEEGNVSRAAKRLGLTQSATSHALATLRVEFDDELLVRSSRGMIPTEYALRLQPELRAALTTLSQVVTTRAQFDPKKATRTFSLASADFLLAPLGRELAHQFDRKLPNGSLRLETTRIESLADRLLSRELDLAIGPALSLDGSIQSEPLREEPWVTALSAEHPLTKKLKHPGALSLEHFLELDHGLVSPTGRGTSSLDRQLAERGLARRVRLRFDSFSSAATALAGARFVLTAPRALFRAQERKFRLFTPPLPLPPLRLVLHYERARASAPELLWFMSEVRRATRLLDD